MTRKQNTQQAEELLALSVKETEESKGLFDWVYTALSERSEAKLFEQGLKFIEDSSDFHLEIAIDKPKNCFLQIYRRAKPKPVKGITYPPNFNYYRPPTSTEIQELNDNWRNWFSETGADNIDVCAFWLPFATSKGSAESSPLAKYTSFVTRNSEDYANQCSSLLTYKQGISLNPAKLPTNKIPRAFIPEKEWFADCFADIKPEDIITLFPPAELKMFSLILGRALVGRDMTLPLEFEEGQEIAHKFRKMGIIFGKDPATGKSTMCNAIIEAMQMCGYNVSNFRGLGEKFNMSSIYSSDLAFKDDAGDAGIETMLNSPDLKTVITGGRLRAENKGTDAFEITANCAVLLNTNRLDQNALFGKDEGILDRLAILYTYSNIELKNNQISDSPDLRTHQHLTWLANKLNVDISALFFWFFRHCVDTFMQHYNANTLETEVNKISGQLRFPISHNALANVVSAMHLAYFIRTNNKRALALTNLKTFAFVFKCYAFIQGDPRAHVIRTLIKQNWEKLGRPVLHPWVGLKLVSVSSLQSALFTLDDKVNNKDLTLDLFIKEIFSKLSTNQGITIGSGPTYIKRAWAETVETILAIHLQQIASSCIEQHKSSPVLVNTTASLIAEGANISPNLTYSQLAGYSADYCVELLDAAWENAKTSKEQVDFLKAVNHI